MRSYQHLPYIRIKRSICFGCGPEWIRHTIKSIDFEEYEIQTTHHVEKNNFKRKRIITNDERDTIASLISNLHIPPFDANDTCTLMDGDNYELSMRSNSSTVTYNWGFGSVNGWAGIEDLFHYIEDLANLIELDKSRPL